MTPYQISGRCKKVAGNLVLTVANSVNCFRHRSVGESGKGGEADG